MDLIVIETPRLALRRLTANDADFILEMLNDPAWLRFIGDRGVRTLEEARRYVADGPVAMYDRFGFGLYLAELKEAGTPIGICGLVRRDGLDGVDLGFAFLPQFRAQGYAREAASAVVAYGWRELGLGRILAITSPENTTAARLLEWLGFRPDGVIRLPSGTAELRLFSIEGPDHPPMTGPGHSKGRGPVE